MTKTFLSLFLLYVSFFISCSSKKIPESEINNGFVLEGKLKDIEDSTWIFLDLNNTIDSAQVIDGKFSFSGKVDNPKQGVIATKDYTDYKFLWIENAGMTFEAEKGNFREAKVSGSSVQDEANVLFASQKQLHNRRDSLTAVIRREGLKPEERVVVLKQLEDKGKALASHGEGPKVFQWKGYYWMIVDSWNGLSVYRSTDLLQWELQPQRLLEAPGTGPEDAAIGGHPDVVVEGDRAYLFYFTHPGRNPHNPAPDTDVESRRSLIQLTELNYKDGWLHSDRNKPVYISLKKK